ncbi:NucA/NucB deoxyribonuclease domain-containing protein [Amycolatopsis nalaikhensis]|uniref:NucA/NucB deoxyribonuclease domain-containing protein n=1 Tax=Amycolatopsis nalaikhensis TaxID=715472 RepID=UPI00332EDE21
MWGPYDGNLLNCDEYPFKSTREGAAKGDGNYSARLIDARDNQAAGNWLNSNYTPQPDHRRRRLPHRHHPVADVQHDDQDCRGCGASRPHPRHNCPHGTTAAIHRRSPRPRNDRHPRRPSRYL